MDSISAAPSLAIPQLTGFDRPKDAKQAATQFEALLISQLLKTMRTAGAGGWLGTDDEDADASMLEIAEEHLAQVLASQGGLGLAGLVMKGLEPSGASPKAAADPVR